MIFTNFGFLIPSSANIEGITIDIERFHDGTGSGSLKDNDIKLTKDGLTAVGQNRKDATDWDDVESYHTYGNSTDMWGTSWTYDEINSSNFGIMIQLSKSQNGNRIGQIDHVRIIIHYIDPLPIELLYFTGKSSSGVAKLEWASASEANNNFYTIEKSNDTQKWNMVATIDAIGNSSFTTKYEHLSIHEKGVNYYKLSQTDFDGTTEILGIIYVKRSSDDEQFLKIYPNPGRPNEFIVICCFPVDKIEISDMSGKIIKCLIQNNKFTIRDKGTYVVKINDRIIKKIIIK